MIALGYNEYGTSLLPLSLAIYLLIFLAVTQGGDWGFVVSEISPEDGNYVYILSDHSENGRQVWWKTSQGVAHQLSDVYVIFSLTAYPSTHLVFD